MRCRCGHERHAGAWCTECEHSCASLLPQPLDDETGEPLPPVPVDGQRWSTAGRKITPRYRDG